MKTKLIIPTLGLIGLSAVAQVVPNIDWVQFFSERNQVSNVPSAIDANNNVYTVGYSYTTPSNADITILKYNAIGILVWTRHYDNGSFDDAKAVTLDATGNIYVTGESDGTGTWRDIITIKLDASGNQLWATRYNGTGNAGDGAVAQVVDASGNVYVTGKTTSTGGNVNYVTLKYNASGVQQWVNTYNGTGNAVDNAVAIDFSSTNRLFVSGTATNASGNTDIVTLRINPNTGAQQWVKTINGTANANDIAYALTTDGNDVVVVGSQNNSTTGEDYVTLKYNGNNGNTLWQKNYDSANSLNRATAIVKDANGNFAVTGISLNGAIVEYHTLLYANNGTQQWVNTASTGLTYTNANPQIATDAIANHFYVCGQKNTNVSDILVYQITPSGNTTWEQTIDGSLHNLDVAVDLVVNAQGVVYVAGASLNSNAKFDYATAKISQTPVYFVPDLTNESYSPNGLYYANKGQLLNTNGVVETGVKFYNNLSNSPEYYIQNQKVSYKFAKIDTIDNTIDTLEKIDLAFLNSSPFAKLFNFEKENTSLNYFLPHCGANGITDVAGYKRLFVPNLYTDIDLQYYSNGNGIKYYFIVKPNANPKTIRLAIQGAQSHQIVGGNLTINGLLGNFTLGSVQAYQINFFGNSVPLAGSATWLSNGGNNYGFNLPTYNSALPLVIMVSRPVASAPTSATTGNLNYSTFYGNTGNEQFNDIKTDANFRYIAGYANSGTFPTPNGIIAYKGLTEAVLLKYTLNTDSLRFATFYSGTENDVANSVAVTKTGRIYIAGVTTSTDIAIQIKPGASNQTVNYWYPPSTQSSRDDGFIAEFRNDGQQLKWGRYVGGTFRDFLAGITVDSLENLYVCGNTTSNDFPITAGAYKTSKTGNFGVNSDMFVMKFDSNSLAQWSTFYGGNLYVPTTTTTPVYGDDFARTIAVDNTGHVYVGGITNSYDYPILFPGTPTANSALYSTRKYVNDGALVKFTPTGTPVWSTYFGGDRTDEITNIKITSTNDIIIAGKTTSQDSLIFPIKRKAGAFNFIYSSFGEKVFYSKITSNLDNEWTTFYGKHAYSQIVPSGLVIANDGFIACGYGTNDSINIPAVTPGGVYTKPTKSPTTVMGYLTYFDSNQALIHAHYFGNSGSTLRSVAVDKNLSLYTVGYGYAQYPIAYTPANATLIDSTYSGSGYDGVITRLSLYPVLILAVNDVTKNTSSGIIPYPNPVFDAFFINTTDLKEAKNYSINVYNV